jgi:hypothetical protein
LLLLHWPFGKDTRFNFQYPELDSNLDGPDFHGSVLRELRGCATRAAGL